MIELFQAFPLTEEQIEKDYDSDVEDYFGIYRQVEEKLVEGEADGQKSQEYVGAPFFADVDGVNSGKADDCPADSGDEVPVGSVTDREDGEFV